MLQGYLLIYLLDTRTCCNITKEELPSSNCCALSIDRIIEVVVVVSLISVANKRRALCNTI